MKLSSPSSRSFLFPILVLVFFGLMSCFDSVSLTSNSESEDVKLFHSGKIFDVAGEPISGMEIVSRRFGLADTTGLDGAWKIYVPSGSDVVDSGNDEQDTLDVRSQGAVIDRILVSGKTDSTLHLVFVRKMVEGTVALGNSFHLWPGQPCAVRLVVDYTRSPYEQSLRFDSASGWFSSLVWLPAPDTNGTVAARVEVLDRKARTVATSRSIEISRSPTGPIRFDSILPDGGFRPPPAFAIEWLGQNSVDLDTFRFKATFESFNGEKLSRIDWIYDRQRKDGSYERMNVGAGETLSWHRPDLPEQEAMLAAVARLAGGDSIFAYVRLPKWTSSTWARIDSLKQTSRHDSLKIYYSDGSVGGPKLKSKITFIQGMAVPIATPCSATVALDPAQPGYANVKLEEIDARGDSATSTGNVFLYPDIRYESLKVLRDRIKLVVGGSSLPGLKSGTLRSGEKTCDLKLVDTCIFPRDLWNGGLGVSSYLEWPSERDRFRSLDTSVSPQRSVLDFEGLQLVPSSGFPNWNDLEQVTSSSSSGSTDFAYSTGVQGGRKLSGNVLRFDWSIADNSWFSQSIALNGWSSATDNTGWCGGIRLTFDNDSLDVLVTVADVQRLDFLRTSVGWVRGWLVPKNTSGEVVLSPDSLRWYRVPTTPGLTTAEKPKDDPANTEALLADRFGIRFTMICGDEGTNCTRRRGALEIGEIELLPKKSERR